VHVNEQVAIILKANFDDSPSKEHSIVKKNEMDKYMELMGSICGKEVVECLKVHLIAVIARFGR